MDIVKPENWWRLLEGCPPKLHDIMEEIERLRYFDEPNYQLIYTTLKSVLAGRPETPYDWERTIALERPIDPYFR